MPSLRHIPLEGAALREFNDLQEAEKCRGYDYPSNCPSDCQTLHHDEGANDNSKQIQGPANLDCVVSSRNEDPSTSASNNHAADCLAGNIEEHACAYADKSNYVVYNNTKRGEEGYLSDTILDQVLNCDYTHISETHDHTVHVSSSLDKRKHQQDQTAVNSRIGTVIDVRKKFKSHHAYTHHQRGEDKQEVGHHPTVTPAQHHDMIPFSASIISNTVKKHDEQENGQDNISLHDSSFLSEDEARRTDDTTTVSAALTEGDGTEGCEPKRKKLVRKYSSFEERLEELKAFKVKHGHCNVKNRPGVYKSLGRWCLKVKQSISKIENNEAPLVAGLSEKNIARLEDMGLDWKASKKTSFVERLDELEAFKAKYGHCIVKTNSGDHKSLGRWCSMVRCSMPRIKNNKAPLVAGLSEKKIARLEDIGFDWKVKKISFEERLEELKAYKVKHGHCNVKNKPGDHKSLGRWCSMVKCSMKNIKNNKAPVVGGLSKENITRLEDIGLDWKVKQISFEERLEELKAYKEKHGHCIVKATSGDHMSLGRWCLRVRAAMKKVMNNEAPVVGGLSEDSNIKRLDDIGFYWNESKNG